MYMMNSHDDAQKHAYSNIYTGIYMYTGILVKRKKAAHIFHGGDVCCRRSTAFPPNHGRYTFNKASL